MSMRVCHTESSTGWGGQEIRVLTEAAGLRDRGHRVTIVCQPGSRLAARAQEVALPVVALPMQHAYNLATMLRLAGCFRRLRPQVVVTHSSVDGWCAGTAARLLRVPVVRMRHLSIPVGAHPATRFVYRRLADRVITTAEVIRQHLIRDVGLPAERVVSIPTGVDTARFDPAKVDGGRVRAELGAGPGTRLVGVVAVLRDWKGHQVFLEALAQVRREAPAARGVIVGDGPQRRNIDRRIGEMGLADAVCLTGHREDVPEVLAALDLVVSASTRAEGVPQALLQALCMERPVVATSVGGIPEIVRDGETGLLVPPADPARLAGAILRALRDPGSVQQMAKAAARTVREGCDLRHMLDAVERVYAEAAGAVARPPAEGYASRLR